MLKTPSEKAKELLKTLSTPIDVYGKIEYKNELGETDYKYEKVSRIWCEIIPQTGKLQTQTANTILADVSHKIIVRYGAGKDITNDMYFIFGGHRFDIKYILNPYFKNEWLEIFCSEVLE